MLAWDGDLWGTTLADVPTDQLGRTDAVQVVLAHLDNAMYPRFTQPVIVPDPEPSVLAMTVMGGGLLLGRRRKGKHMCS